MPTGSPKVCCLPCQKSDPSIPRKSDVFKINDDNNKLFYYWNLLTHTCIMLVYQLYNIILVITYTLLHALCRLLTDFWFSAGPTDERYVTGGGGSGRCDTLWQGGGGGQNWPKKALRISWTAPKPYVPREPRRAQVIVGSRNMGYISDTARNRTHNLFRLKREPIPLCHNDLISGIFLPRYS